MLGSNRLELVVDPWLEGLWKAIKDELSNMTSFCVKEASDASTETPDPTTADVQLNLLSIADSQNCQPMGQSGKLATSAAPPVPTTQSAVPDVRPDSSSSNPGLASQADGAFSADDGVASLTRSLPPLSECALNVPALPPPYLTVSLQELETTEEVRTADEVSVCCDSLAHISQLVSPQVFGPLNKENLHEVPISRAAQLTRGDSVKTALLLELDITVSLNLFHNSKPVV